MAVNKILQKSPSFADSVHKPTVSKNASPKGTSSFANGTAKRPTDKKAARHATSPVAKGVVKPATRKKPSSSATSTISRDAAGKTPPKRKASAKEISSVAHRATQRAAGEAPWSRVHRTATFEKDTDLNGSKTRGNDPKARSGDGTDAVGTDLNGDNAKARNADLANMRARHHNGTNAFGSSPAAPHRDAKSLDSAAKRGANAHGADARGTANASARATANVNGANTRGAKAGVAVSAGSTHDKRGIPHLITKKLRARRKRIAKPVPTGIRHPLAGAGEAAEGLLRAAAAEIGLGRAIELLQGERDRVQSLLRA
ncbi:MAG: hypothetical protein ABSC94_13275 [Polyangiaceae bacterium]|jgi:hypothetical protein